MKRASINDQYCSIARPAAQLIDAWSFLILREVFLGNCRYDGIRVQTGMSPRSLALRLALLVENGILEKVPYQESPLRHQYNLTEKGLDLAPVMDALRLWGEKWLGPWGPEGPPIRVEHKGHNHDLELGFVCKECGEPVDVWSGEVHMSRRMQRERQKMIQRSSSQRKSQA